MKKIKASLMIWILVFVTVQASLVFGQGGDGTENDLNNRFSYTGNNMNEVVVENGEVVSIGLDKIGQSNAVTVLEEPLHDVVLTNNKNIKIKIPKNFFKNGEVLIRNMDDGSVSITVYDKTTGESLVQYTLNGEIKFKVENGFTSVSGKGNKVFIKDGASVIVDSMNLEDFDVVLNEKGEFELGHGKVSSGKENQENIIGGQKFVGNGGSFSVTRINENEIEGITKTGLSAEAGNILVGADGDLNFVEATKGYILNKGSVVLDRFGNWKSSAISKDGSWEYKSPEEKLVSIKNSNDEKSLFIYNDGNSRNLENEVVVGQSNIQGKGKYELEIKDVMNVNSQGGTLSIFRDNGFYKVEREKYGKVEVKVPIDEKVRDGVVLISKSEGNAVSVDFYNNVPLPARIEQFRNVFLNTNNPEAVALTMSIKDLNKQISDLNTEKNKLENSLKDVNPISSPNEYNRIRSKLTEIEEKRRGLANQLSQKTNALNSLRQQQAQSQREYVEKAEKAEQHLTNLQRLMNTPQERRNEGWQRDVGREYDFILAYTSNVEASANNLISGQGTVEDVKVVEEGEKQLQKEQSFWSKYKGPIIVIGILAAIITTLILISNAKKSPEYKKAGRR